MVVVPPESQVNVPPVARSVAVTGFEPPPVFGPVHPLRVTLPEAFPEMVLHTMDPAAPAVPAAIPSVSPVIGTSNAATVSKTRFKCFPFSLRSSLLVPGTSRTGPP